jgi:hypothetical protein
MTLPPVPESFYWTTESWGAALRCRPLEAVAPHLFTTRHLTLAHAADYDALAKGVGAANVVTLTQVHGASAHVIRRGVLPDERPEADILVSDVPDVAIAVRAADCVPILMADRLTGSVSAVHAGWRGTAARAAVSALNAMEREYGTHPRNVVAAIGPSIGPVLLRGGVGAGGCICGPPDTIDISSDRWFSDPAPTAWNRVSVLSCASTSPGPTAINSCWPACHRSRSMTSGLCTAMHLDVLTSYRAEKENAGRIAAVIVAAQR